MVKGQRGRGNYYSYKVILRLLPSPDVDPNVPASSGSTCHNETKTEMVNPAGPQLRGSWHLFYMMPKIFFMRITCVRLLVILVSYAAEAQAGGRREATVVQRRSGNNDDEEDEEEEDGDEE